MADLQDRETPAAKLAELNDAELLGFEHIEAKPGATTSTEDAVGLAFNKRGDHGEGVPSDRRLKTHVKRDGATAEGLSLYRFRYLGDDREFRGVMAQDLLADERNCHAVKAGADGYFRVDYARLGLASLVTPEMRAAGERAASLAD